MKVVAVTNHRGGVGKSTTTMMIAEGLALQHDYRVLVLDFDPQAMITVNLIGVAALDKLSHSQTTVVELLLGRLQGMKTPIYSFILTGVSDIQELHSGASHGRVDLAPMHPRLLAHMSGFEGAFANSPNRRPADDLISETWKQELSRLEEFYDLVLIDCPAGATALALSALRLSDVLILPTLLERNSLSLLDHFLKVIVNDKLEINTNLRGNILLLPTLFVRSNPVQHMLLDQLTRTGKEMFIPCPVPHSTVARRRRPDRSDSMLPVLHETRSQMPELRREIIVYEQNVHGAMRGT